VNTFGLPNEPQFDTMNEKFDTMNEHLRKIANTRVQEDYTMAPGSKFLMKGNRTSGFFGFVPSADFISGTALATELGITAGTAQNSDEPWIKHIVDGKIRFTPLKTFRHSIPWDAIYNAGAVYGNGGDGFLPPMGRAGLNLSIDATDNSINTTNQNFLGDKTSGMDYADTVGAIGDTLVLKGWANGANNGTFTIDSITNTKIVLSGGALVTEAGGKESRFYNQANIVTQNATVVIGGLTYRVMLFRGAADDPLDSYSDADRGSLGVENEWNRIMLPLHERAKLQNWNYPQYAGTTEYWETDLTDRDMNTHYTLGSGSHSWCQEVQDVTTWRRALRGGYGASFLRSLHSWGVLSNYGWRPVLELLG
jgi:hypothetical protein